MNPITLDWACPECNYYFATEEAASSCCPKQDPIDWREAPKFRCAKCRRIWSSHADAESCCQEDVSMTTIKARQHGMSSIIEVPGVGDFLGGGVVE